MKKTRMLIATLVCAVMLMGVGYAWWTDTITLGWHCSYRSHGRNLFSSIFEWI